MRMGIGLTGSGVAGFWFELLVGTAVSGSPLLTGLSQDHRVAGRRVQLGFATVQAIHRSRSHLPSLAAVRHLSQPASCGHAAIRGTGGTIRIAAVGPVRLRTT